MKTSILFAVVILTGNFCTAQNQRLLKHPMPTRQVHLDFHTSEYIEGIGAEFDKRQWQRALQTGRVNHINIFGKGHHGWSYYPTKVGKQHPHLHFDLLGAQIEACHEIGVKAPIYFTIGWSVNDAKAHPEWIARHRNGEFITNNWDWSAGPLEVRPNYSWTVLCPASSGPYHQHILRQLEEICQNYDVDGFWFDIYHMLDHCYCRDCLARMKKEEVDINDEYAVARSMNLAFKDHMKELRELIAKYHPGATAYFNATTRLKNKPIFTERLYDMNTHQDLEDLPTTWGGYDKLPLDAKYHLGQGTPVTAMSGKFHKAWGEFGGFKHSDAIKYEAAAMMSFGASCNFGDQLHPCGLMDMDTYKNIGIAYEYVEKIEAYGPGGTPVSNLGVWLSLDQAGDQGLVKMLLEMHYDFVVANEDNLADLQLVILPSHTQLTKTQTRKLNEFANNGGKIIAFGHSIFDRETGAPRLNMTTKLIGASTYNFDYTVVKSAALQQDVVSSPFLNYESGYLLKAGPKADILAMIREPYFNRTYTTYSSHRETPFKRKDSPYPAVVLEGNILIFAHELDRLYYTHGVRLHRELAQNGIDMMWRDPVLNIKGLPSAGRVSLLKQKNQHRYVVHLLYSPPLQRGEVQVIEDIIPIYSVSVELRVQEKIEQVMQVPDGQPLAFRQEEGVIKVQVPKFSMHCAIVFAY